MTSTPAPFGQGENALSCKKFLDDRNTHCPLQDQASVPDRCTMPTRASRVTGHSPNFSTAGVQLEPLHISPIDASAAAQPSEDCRETCWYESLRLAIRASYP